MANLQDGCLQPTQAINIKNETNMETSDLAFSASSFAEVLVHVGKRIGDAEHRVQMTYMEFDNAKNELKKSQEYARKCDSFIKSLQEQSDKDAGELRNKAIQLKQLQATYDKLKAKVTKAGKVAKSRHKPKGSTTKAQTTLETRVNYPDQRGEEREDGEFEPKDQR